ncbi:MAG: ion transporter [Candidatus Bathyarchaeota archaeon]|nr:ion transporter [Candidatus Bathyarchaeota archaeon]
MPNQRNQSASETLPRSLFAPQNDPRADLREMVDAVFSDRLMIFLSLIIVPMLLVPIFFQLNDSVLVFLEICDWIIVLLFVAEYLTKLYVAEDRWRHFKSSWHIVDLLIIVLPFVQYLPLLQLTLTGSPSLLLRLLRLPRAIAVGGRAVAGRRAGGSIALESKEMFPETLIRQVDSELEPKTLSWSEFREHLADSTCEEWIDLQHVSDEGFLELSRVLGVSELHFKSNLVDDIFPHIDYVAKSSFIFLQRGKIQYPEHAGKDFVISRLGLIAICNGTKVITVSRHSTAILENILPSLKQRRDIDAFAVPVLYSLLDYMLSGYRSVLSEIEIELLKISATPRSKLPKDFLERIYQLDKEVSRVVSNLLHFKDMLSVIISRKVPLAGFDEDGEEAFHVLQDSAAYLNEISHDLIENLRSIIDLYINQTSFETNRILKILAVVTSISVIPSAVSGVIGANLLDVPYGAFLWQVSFVIAICMAFAAYSFVKLGWLKT